MSRVLKSVTVPSGVTTNVSGQTVTFKGSKGELSFDVNQNVTVLTGENEISFAPSNSRAKNTSAMVGTMRSLATGAIKGVSEGFEKKLQLVGVGYRAQAQGKILNLTLGFSHPVNHNVPDGITVETPSQTEILVKGIDKQLVGQVAANIRAYRPPEPYKGKGVRYADERVVRKEAKKK